MWRYLEVKTVKRQIIFRHYVSLQVHKSLEKGSVGLCTSADLKVRGGSSRHNNEMRYGLTHSYQVCRKPSDENCSSSLSHYLPHITKSFNSICVFQTIKISEISACSLFKQCPQVDNLLSKFLLHVYLCLTPNSTGQTANQTMLPLPAEQYSLFTTALPQNKSSAS